MVWLSLACGAEPTTPPSDVGGSGGTGGSGGSPETCSPGAIEGADGICHQAGIDPEDCPVGFEPIDSACLPVLPAETCPKGLMALAGETTCRAVAPCGAGTWGDIPVETNTEHVDPSYAGGGSDGSASTPWTTISAAIAAADSGAIVALAAGSYGAVSLQGKALRLWGRCPEMVEIVGGANDTAAVFIREGADGSELRDLAITGSSIGLLLSGSLAVLADRVWIHDLGSRAVNVEITLGPTALTVARSLVEEAVEFGIQFSGVEGAVVDTVVRDVSRLGNSMFGRGINIQPSQADDIRAAVMVEGALIERTHEAGMFIASSDASVENTVIRDIQAGTQGDARGINIQDKNLTGDPASVTVSGVFIDRTRVVGLYVAGSEADIEHVFVRDTQPNDAGIGGIGISFELNQITDHLASGVIRASVIENSVASGANLSASQVAITGLLVRGVELAPKIFSLLCLLLSRSSNCRCSSLSLFQQ